MLHEDGELGHAEEHYRRAQSFGLEDAELCLGLGRVLEEAGRIEEARPLYERAVALRPSWDQAHFRVSHLLRLTGDQAGAEREMEAFYRWNAVERELSLAREAAREAPGDPARHVREAQLLFQLERDDAALASMRRAAAAAPGDVGLAVELGALCLALGRSADALEAFGAALALEAGHVEARLGRAQALVGLGRVEEARRDYRAVLEAHPGDGRAQASLEALGRGGGR